MKLAILRVGDMKISKFSGLNTQRVTLEDIENPKQYYYLNLDRKHKDVARWMPYMKEGNVLDVTLQKGENSRNVDLFKNFLVIKEVGKEQQ